MLALAPFGQSLLHTDMPTPRDRIMIETTAFGVGQGVRQMHVYEVHAKSLQDVQRSCSNKQQDEAQASIAHAHVQ